MKLRESFSILLTIFFTQLIFLYYNEIIFNVLDEKLKNSLLLIIGTLSTLYLINFIMSSEDCGQIIFKFGLIYVVFVVFMTIFYLVDRRHFIEYFKGVDKEKIIPKIINETLPLENNKILEEIEQVSITFSQIKTEAKPTITTREMFLKNFSMSLT
jgi:hypothetical protein